jgi:hypothetical protein
MTTQEQSRESLRMTLIERPRPTSSRQIPETEPWHETITRDLERIAARRLRYRHAPPVAVAGK